MLPTEMLWILSNVLLFILFILLSRMTLKARLARKIAMRLLMDDVYYHETRSALIQKNVERAPHYLGRTRISTGTVAMCLPTHDPQAAWAAAIHTSTRIRLRSQPEPAPSIMEKPYLWATTWASKDKAWSTTIGLVKDEEKVTRPAQPVANHVTSPVTNAATNAATNHLTNQSTRRVAKKPARPGKSAVDLLNLGLMRQAVACD
ncbi:hypothetical protein H8L32_05135 [Undibacterium sp. CY18W]|uniref:Uncharacterized protein n=1 Tax=Undibacterium hunanense TaxID=2762292 RepID=A0ABR6ZLU0_9BURK|nr:hypothetical protein [Undibacterium hunanense]MBC3916852.1 hypothetical protein [Undibacterium hunanense]